MVGSILNALLGAIRFIHGRFKSRANAREKLQYLRFQLVLYAVLGSWYFGQIDQDLVQWAKNELDSIPPERRSPEASAISRSLESVLESDIKDANALTELFRPSNSGETKMFMKLNMPAIEERHLSSGDVGILAQLNTKLGAINTMAAELRELNPKTFDRSLTPDQVAAVKKSIDNVYRGISVQARDGTDILARLDLLDSDFS